MALAITEEHADLSGVVREFAVEQGARAAARRAAVDPPVPGADPDPLWKQSAGLGWTGLHLPEEHGGSGYGLPELAVVLEGLGREVHGGPLLPTAVASALVARHGTDEQRAALLPGLADGSTPASLAVAGSIGSDGRGDAGPALGAVWAALHLVRSGDDVVVLRGDAVRVSARDGLDPSLGVAAVAVEGSGEVLVGAAASATRLLRVLAAAEAAGGARATLDMALAYAKVREQFGRIIGSFQAIKHHLADMQVRSELAVATAWDAARAEGDDGQADLAAATAAAVAVDAYLQNARMNIQVHGGIGFTWEHDAHLYLRRATALSALAAPLDAATADVAARVAAGVRRKHDVALPPEAERFRTTAREFAQRYRSAAEGEKRRLALEEGYLVPHWRRPFGREAGPVEQLVLEQELVGLGLPNYGIGGWVLLTLTQTASPEQIERWVRPGLLGEQVWCQLFSEPGAGSDAAAVQTRGVKVDGGWRVTGQKVWTSGAQFCQRGLATIRTNPDASKHAGITAMVIDLTAPEVTVRPLKEITGHSMFNEVFFDDVFVPDEDVVGEPGAGWGVARATLANERVSIGGQRAGFSARKLLGLVDRHTPGDIGLTRQVGALIAEEAGIELLNLRAVERAVIGAEPSVEGNVSKLLGAEHGQRVSELGMRIAGAAAVTGGEPDLTLNYLYQRAMTIAGGTSEVSRNVIAERILGLPREAIMN
ncbi:acyl-CoA dehydrogenase [Pseudonocardia humida]|uniref:Acyl-CoA dehydrogenase n=1 Tax=Pseudonocardia humida TaxID=2800819 RepID=A0ABT1ACK5_9PSEU|nr:acyl-CoA dehydrogenase [Pseudonocardia humida]MCO1660650.1 acyl-CoA dehydrogenase [Pseudonocardia humida]